MKVTATLTAELIEKNGKKVCHYECTGAEKGCIGSGSESCPAKHDMEPSCFYINRPNCPGANYYSIDHWVSTSEAENSFIVMREYRTLVPIKP